MGAQVLVECLSEFGVQMLVKDTRHTEIKTVTNARNYKYLEALEGTWQLGRSGDFRKAGGPPQNGERI